MSTSGLAAPALSARRRWAGLGVLAASLLVIAMDMTILNVALPSLAADLRPGADQQLWIIDVYSLVLAGLLIPMSRLADRWGRKKLLLSGFAVFGGASLLVLAADSAGAVIAVRALLGVGGAMIMPTTLSMIRSLFTDPRERATALGVWAAVSSLGMAVGPIAGGLLLEHFSWHAAFLVNVPLMIAALIAGLVLLPEVRDPAPGRWDVLGTAQAIAGMVALIWAIKRLAKLGPADLPSWAALAAAVALLTWFVLRCLRRTDPLLDVGLFSRRPFTAGVLAALASMFAMAALLLLVAQWFQLVEGFSPLQTGVYLLPMAVGAAIASPLAPTAAAQIGARTTVAGGLALAGLGFLSLHALPLTYPVVLLALTLLGIGASSLAIASAIIMSGTPPEKAGNAAAAEETAYDLGNVLGVAVLGSAASVAYRAHLDGGAPIVPVGAEESLGAALEIAAETGAPELAIRAEEAFNHSLAQTGLFGGLIMIATAIAVFLLLPKNTGLDGKH
ncbi:MFS transporter, DHA2 family, multidrug resistance protein [Saccharopolyspora kobensis]|uniref:MFS transporter, DHA2 family, multidrug resistance protein n=1 Tax=Saccharopolyspora kobensis TaxID=146035 RepID=A0A1H6DUH9_9PSEU|nr:MFS transporter [Saccharopolyspora kobensis]SEG88403.1 MFS transporter, DHA2 family, multidrug resistance protein [Saccharopolyspora kobensis]SFE01240.1 MFS transporter, DHA2 family, multidrug resistance protein [Saccharopolyspora kobensis]